ncbi:hypothetical protein GPALN_004955 [Globodera pallida]|nr:hypothetical protein GPALN_004955 [Globodera pallida]
MIFRFLFRSSYSILPLFFHSSPNSSSSIHPLPFFLFFSIHRPIHLLPFILFHSSSFFPFIAQFIFFHSSSSILPLPPLSSVEMHCPSVIISCPSMLPPHPPTPSLSLLHKSPPFCPQFSSSLTPKFLPPKNALCALNGKKKKNDDGSGGIGKNVLIRAGLAKQGDAVPSVSHTKFVPGTLPAAAVGVVQQAAAAADRSHCTQTPPQCVCVCVWVVLGVVVVVVLLQLLLLPLQLRCAIYGQNVPARDGSGTTALFGGTETARSD